MLEEEHKYLTGKDPNSLSGFQPEIFQGLPKFGTKANDSQLCRPWTNFGLASHRITNETDPFLCLAGPTKIRDLDRVLNCSVPVAGSSAPVLFYPCSSLLLSLVLPIRPSCAITARQELRLYGMGLQMMQGRPGASCCPSSSSSSSSWMMAAHPPKQSPHPCECSTANLLMSDD